MNKYTIGWLKEFDTEKSAQAYIKLMERKYTYDLKHENTGGLEYDFTYILHHRVDDNIEAIGLAQKFVKENEIDIFSLYKKEVIFTEEV